MGRGGQGITPLAGVTLRRDRAAWACCAREGRCCTETAQTLRRKEKKPARRRDSSMCHAHTRGTCWGDALRLSHGLLEAGQCLSYSGTGQVCKGLPRNGHRPEAFLCESAARPVGLRWAVTVLLSQIQLNPTGHHPRGHLCLKEWCSIHSTQLQPGRQVRGGPGKTLWQVDDPQVLYP